MKVPPLVGMNPVPVTKLPILPCIATNCEYKVPADIIVLPVTAGTLLPPIFSEALVPLPVLASSLKRVLFKNVFKSVPVWSNLPFRVAALKPSVTFGKSDKEAILFTVTVQFVNATFSPRLTSICGS